jgi:threonine aldolase
MSVVQCGATQPVTSGRQSADERPAKDEGAERRYHPAVRASEYTNSTSRCLGQTVSEAAGLWATSERGGSSISLARAMNSIDLRSDTVTLPSPEMRRAIAAAPVGDDFYGEDRSVRALESLAAGMLGKEAALFVPSGTMGNLLAHMTHCPGGAEVVGPEPAHTFLNEAGGPSRVAGMTVRDVPQRGGELDIARISALIRARGAGPLTQPTGLLWVEQPTRGHIVPLDDLARLRVLADQHGLPIHMDGARIFNAAVGLGIAASAIASYADSVMFCVSKGLAAPVGSLLVGRGDFIARARLNRQMMGGGMRQAGIVAAAGVFALQHNIERLAEDHENARRLAAGLDALPSLNVDREVVETNIFMVRSSRPNLTIRDFSVALRDRGVLVNVPAPNGPVVRFVTHFGISRDDVDEALVLAADAAGVAVGTIATG